jgi:hypothetical protein
MNIDSLKMATKCHEDSAKNKVLLLFAGEVRPVMSKAFFVNNYRHPPFFNSVAKSWNKFLSTFFLRHTH